MDKEMNHEKNQKNFYHKDIRKIIKNRRFNFTMIKNKINKNQKEKNIHNEIKDENTKNIHMEYDDDNIEKQSSNKIIKLLIVIFVMVLVIYYIATRYLCVGFIKIDDNQIIDKIKTLNPYLEKEWSEEDESTINDIICYIRQRLNYESEKGKKKIQKCENWLKSLRPQNNATDEELTQAKKNAYNDALDKIEYHSEEPTFDDGWDAAIWYLKKRNTMPQSQWKPTDNVKPKFWV